MKPDLPSRRDFVAKTALGAAALALPGRLAGAQGAAAGPITRKIGTSGIAVPTIGLGTWITFNVGNDAKARDVRTAILKEFFAQGGAVVDSSPMYGSSEAVIGQGLARLGHPKQLFAATKVWTPSKSEGEAQVKESRKLWGVETFDLLQVHNLVGWEDHLKLLFEMKAKGHLKHVGITTSHGRRHDDMEKVMRTHPIDFVQLTYNVVDREAEERLLPLAADRKIAVIVNRPYGGGELIDKLKGKRPLPPWGKDVGCPDWPTFLLKFIVSHPAVTCTIPATSQLAHLKENMAAARGPLPDSAARERMAKYVASL